MKHMPLLKSRYTYQQYERTQITNKIRKDLRDKLKLYSIQEIGQPEAKILDMALEYFLCDEKNKAILTELVRNYY